MNLFGWFQIIFMKENKPLDVKTFYKNAIIIEHLLRTTEENNMIDLHLKAASLGIVIQKIKNNSEIPQPICYMARSFKAKLPDYYLIPANQM